MSPESVPHDPESRKAVEGRRILRVHLHPRSPVDLLRMTDAGVKCRNNSFFPIGTKVDDYFYIKKECIIKGDPDGSPENVSERTG